MKVFELKGIGKYSILIIYAINVVYTFFTNANLHRKHLKMETKSCVQNYNIELYTIHEFRATEPHHWTSLLLSLSPLWDRLSNEDDMPATDSQGNTLRTSLCDVIVSRKVTRKITRHWHILSSNNSVSYSLQIATFTRKICPVLSLSSFPRSKRHHLSKEQRTSLLVTPKCC